MIEPPETQEPRQRHNTRPQRKTARMDYKAMNEGSNQKWTEGTTEISKHLAQTNHSKDDYTFELVGTEPSWRKRVMKEAMLIQGEPPTRCINENQGKYTYGAIYDHQLRTGRTPLNAQQADQISEPPERQNTNSEPVGATNAADEPIGSTQDGPNHLH